MVPVRSICELIEVRFSAQDNWLKSHEYFSQLYQLASTTGADGKQYNMRCLPIFDVLSWLVFLAITPLVQSGKNG